MGAWRVDDAPFFVGLRSEFFNRINVMWFAANDNFINKGAKNADNW